MISDHIIEAIKAALKELGIEADKVALEHPAELTHGDYSTNVALMYGKVAGMKPKDLAEKVMGSLAGKVEGVEKIEVAGPGFINFYLSKEFFTESTAEIIKKSEDFGKSNIGNGNKILVEYSSPNIAKPFTVGHLRSTIIGESITRILSSQGYEVIRDNHLGDWGTQFGKMIVAMKKWGDEEKIEQSKFMMKPLVELYIKFHDEAERDPNLDVEAREWFVKLEQGDVEARRIWKRCVDWSMHEFNLIYEKLGIKFDTRLGESFYEDKIKDVMDDIEKSGIAKESEGATLIFFQDDKYPPLMIKKSDGATLYATRDLATDKYRKKTYGKDLKIINEVGVEQSLYFQQLFEAEKLLGYSNGTDRIHVAHGHYRFKEGKMATRKGNVIWLEDIIAEAEKRARAINSDTAEVVGIGAIKFNDLKREAKQDIVFDWDEVVNLKGDSGPYLQYSYARAQSIVTKAKEEEIEPNAKNGLDTITNLEKYIYRFPEVVIRAGQDYAPHYIATYLIELSAAFNNLYGQGKIIDKDDPTSPYKVALTQAFGTVMKNGLNLLGIEAPEKM